MNSTRSLALPAELAGKLDGRQPGWLLNLSVVDYVAAYRLQMQLVALRQAGRIPDTLILLEHPAVLTLGRHAKQQNVLAAAGVLADLGIAVQATDRGGDVTYHGPGQLVGYPIMDLRGYAQAVRGHVHRLEEVLIAVLADYGLLAERRAGFPGVWIGKTKIGFLGVHVSRWVTRHGFSLNVQPNLDHFALIRPCGLEGVRVTSLAELSGRTFDMAEVRQRAAAAFARIFARDLLAVNLGAVAALGLQQV